MVRELLVQSWTNLSRSRTRSLLTMLGIVWGIVAVTVLLAYGSGFRRDPRPTASTPSGAARPWRGRARRASRRAGSEPGGA